MKKTIEKQRKYHIVNLGGTPSGKTIMCAPSKAKHMMSVMGVKFMRHLPKLSTANTEALNA